MDNKGQISFEYLMIFAISLIILIAFTLPLTQTVIEDTLDVSEALSVKSDLSIMAQAIKEVYGQGQGARKEIVLGDCENVKVNIAKNSLSCNLKLKDNTKKVIKENYKSTLKETSITLTKGENIIIIEWPVGSSNMIVYKK